MRVFLTGGHGMVGRNFQATALGSAHQVYAPTRAQLDLRDKASVLRHVAEFCPDVIVHAAGRVGGIAANMADPYAFLIENLEIGANVVEAAVAARVPRLLNLGSSCMYPKDVDGVLREDMVLTGPLEPTNEGYALAKVATMRLCEFATRQDPSLQYKTLIPCNLYGLHDNFDPHTAHLIPAIVRKIHDAKVGDRSTVEIWGDGSARREFMFAGDLAQCMWRCLDRFDELPQLMNVGIGKDHSVLEFYQVVAEVAGWAGSFSFDLDKPAGMRRKLVSIDRQTDWGWQPQTSLHEGIRLTYHHFLSALTA